MIRLRLYLCVLVLVMVSGLCDGRVYRVCVYTDEGTHGKEALEQFQKIITECSDVCPEGIGFELRPIIGDEIRARFLDSADILILPGGSGYGQGESMQPAGVEQVKQFVASGRCLLGICAGAYFPMQQDFLNAKTKSPLWKRGKATLKVELTDKGEEVFGSRFGRNLELFYGNGPVMDINVYEGQPECEVLAWFRSETAENNTPKGIQTNSPAILLSTYGKGTIITSSPHPELTDGLHGMIVEALCYLAKQVQYQPCLPTQGTPAQLRKMVVDYMRAMAEVEWIPAADITWFNPKRGVIFKAGQMYKGLPYTQPGRFTNVEQFKSLLDTSDGKPIYKGPTNPKEYRGTDCSSSVSQAWRIVKPDFPIVRTWDMLPGTTEGVVAVGEYGITSSSTKKIIADNGRDVICAAYDQLQPGDAVVTRNPTGHIRMVSRLDRENRTVYIIEQTGLSNEGTLKSDHQSWRVDYPFTYDQLLETYYIPVTLANLIKPENTKNSSSMEDSSSMVKTEKAE